MTVDNLQVLLCKQSLVMGGTGRKKQGKPHLRELRSQKPLRALPFVSFICVKQEIVNRTWEKAVKGLNLKCKKGEQQGQIGGTWLFPGKVNGIKGEIKVVTTTPTTFNQHITGRIPLVGIRQGQNKLSRTLLRNKELPLLNSFPSQCSNDR